MSDDRRAVMRTFRVGRFVCELTVPVPVMGGSGVAVATVEWSPRVPDRLSADERATYEVELAEAIADAMEARP